MAHGPYPIIKKRPFYFATIIPVQVYRGLMCAMCPVQPRRYPISYYLIFQTTDNVTQIKVKKRKQQDPISLVLIMYQLYD